PFMSPRYPGGPRPPLRIPNQALGGVPGSQPLLPSGMDPTRQQGHPNMGGPMQRMTPPRGMVPLGPQVPSTDRRPFLWISLYLSCYSGGPGGGRPWPNPTNANSIPYSSASPGNYVVSTPMCVCLLEWITSRFESHTQSVEVNNKLFLNYIPAYREFPMGPGSDGPMSGLGGMDSHHMNGSLG
ncbi:SSBP2 protein, partial [Probosciger aterrimus]|nr:SSBP2 protein [Probosciger aterrimus]